MSSVHLGAVLRQVRRLFADGCVTGLTDAALLHRYVADADGPAFAALVARHGPMVLSVCRGVLRNEPDAEDAFQATFLVLVRRSGSVQVDDSLGAWLHGVAFRVAVRANADAVRRRSRVRTGVGVEGAEARDERGTGPQLAALHEEIDRLPESHRRALVLCLLEGKTHAQAALEIGCGEATVRRRLASARERLRARLDRRRLALLVPPLPAVPPAWTEAVTRIATAAPSASCAAILATSVLAEMARARLYRVAMALAALGIGTACVAGVVLAAQGPPPSKPAVQLAAPAPEPQPQPLPADFGRQPEGEVIVPGRVVGPDGNGVAGATVFLRGFGVRLPARKATTDASGRFRFGTPHELGWKVTETAPGKMVAGAYPDADEIRRLKPRLIAVAPGFGFGVADEGDEVTLRLVADDPVTGRVTDRAGRPIAGARARVRNLYRPKADDLGPWVEAIKRATYIREFQRVSGTFLEPLVDSLGDIPAAHAPLVPPVTTDADGRFRLAGVGKERVAEVIIDGLGIASSLEVVATRPMTAIPIPAMTPAMKGRLSNSWDDLTVFGDVVHHVAGPGRVVEGVVTERGTGKPLAGLTVHGPWRSPLEYHEYDRFQSPTDEQGRYRIEGLPVPSTGDFTIKPPEDRPYLGRAGHLKITPGPGAFQLNISLRRGVWITGRVVDDATGEPLRQAPVEYYVFSDNPTLRNDLLAGAAPEMHQVRTDNDGNFRVAGYPGRGIVTAWAGSYLAGVGADRIFGLRPEQPNDQFYPPFRFSPQNVEAVVEVNPAEGAESVACELRLKKGKGREVLIVGPDGAPVAGTEASGLARQIENPMTKVDKDRFTVTNLSAGEAREVVARLVSRKLMGTATVTYEDEGPVTLRLRPWATLTGRLVDDQGKPRSKALEVQLDDGKLPLHTLNGRGYDRPDFPIDPDGRFRIEGLVAGPRYGLEVIEGGIQVLGDVATGLVFTPGEARDLGDVKVAGESK